MRTAQGLGAGIAALFVAVAADAAGPYDGAYVGTSATFNGTQSGREGRSCPKFPAPGPLTITNGHAQTKWGDGMLEGDVTPQGALVMHSALSAKFEGQIDAKGSLTGGFLGICQYNLAWQRKG
jgi:hypothetical protein